MTCNNPYKDSSEYSCKCHEKMGNDFWFLPAGQCVYAEKRKPLVIIESPFAGDVEANKAYARKCVADAVYRGEAPIASHLLFTQPGILDDLIPGERALGIEAGLAWYRVADKCVVYMDRGESGGMRTGIERARANGLEPEIRYIEREVAA